MRLRIDLGYDGTDFHGWARQPGLRSVQGELEAALEMVIREPARLVVAGRTDAGVHARGQVAHIDVDETRAERLTARKLRGVLRRRAPDIAVHAIAAAPTGFDARFGAVSRRYEYRVRDEASRRDPLAARFTAEVPTTLDLSAMQRASEELIGLQDFSTFCIPREGATAVRDLQRFDWQIAPDGVFVASIVADAFCHSMVRSLVGAVVAVGSGRFGRPELIDLRDARTRTSRFAVMPAHGLSLEEIEYPPDAELAERAEQTRARRDPLEPNGPLQPLEPNQQNPLDPAEPI